MRQLLFPSDIYVPELLPRLPRFIFSFMVIAELYSKTNNNEKYIMILPLN